LLTTLDLISDAQVNGLLLQSANNDISYDNIF